MKPGTYAEYYDKRYMQTRNISRLLQVSKRLKHMEFYRLLRSYVKPGASVLDVGCGDGTFAILISKQYWVYACDSSGATMKRNNADYPNTVFFQADATEKLPKQGGRISYDAVVCMDLIEHIDFKNQATLLSNLAEVLEPGGVLIISTPDREVSLKFKKDETESDKDFLKRMEDQPRSDQLTSLELDELISRYFKIEYRTAIVPAVKYRILDLIWKSIGFFFGYKGVNWLTTVFGLESRYLIRLARK